MHFLSSLAVLSSVSFVYSSPIVPSAETSTIRSTNPHNANHIFNAIHSSMRQWGSSLNHNGMSLFIATVPAGTQLYHGSPKEEFVQGMEWLAFEPEHALIFARAWRGPRRPPPEEGDDGRHVILDEEEFEEGHGPDDGDYWRGPHFMPPGHDEQRPDKHHNRPYPPPPPPHGRPQEPPFNHPGPPPPMPPSNHGSPPKHDMPPPPPPPPPHQGDSLEHGMPPPPPPPFPPPPPPPPNRENPPEHDMPPPPFPPPPPPPSHHGNPPKHDMPPPPFPPPPPPHHRQPPKHGRPHPPSPPQGQPPNGHPPSGKPFHEPPKRRERKLPQHPFNINEAIPNADDPEHLPGYLHTYAPLRDLRLLYIDGMSAGKTSNGTLDSQDKLLLNLTSDQCQGMMCERERARGLCDLAKGVWQDKVDGVIRMEGGFEIILCDFERDLERVDVMKVVAGGNNWTGGSVMGGWRYVQAVADRYHGIGGGRVSLDYEHFVTVFEYPGLDLFTNDVNSDMPMPRLQNVGDSDLIKMRDAVTEMVLASDSDKTSQSTKWQEVADLVVKRYSMALHNLATNRDLRDSKEGFAEYLSALLRPFIDWTARNSTLEISRCGAQLVPRLPAPPALAPFLAHRAVHAVNHEICFTLLSALDVTLQSMSHSLSHGAPPTRALDLVDSLVDYLQWTTWKDCGTCLDDEVCVIPIWPMGNFEDHAHPKCKTEGGVKGMGNYWGMRWGRGPPPGDRPGEGRGGREGGRGHGVEGGKVGRKHLHHKGCGKGRQALGSLGARILGALRGVGLRW